MREAIICIENIRAVLRPYLRNVLSLQDMLAQLWPLLLSSGGDSRQLSQAIQRLLGAQAIGALSEESLRKELAKLFDQVISQEATVVVSDLKSDPPDQSSAKPMATSGCSSSPLAYQPSATFED